MRQLRQCVASRFTTSNSSRVVTLAREAESHATGWGIAPNRSSAAPQKTRPSSVQPSLSAVTEAPARRLPNGMSFAIAVLAAGMSAKLGDE